MAPFSYFGYIFLSTQPNDVNFVPLISGMLLLIYKYSKLHKFWCNSEVYQKNKLHGPCHSYPISWGKSGIHCPSCPMQWGKCGSQFRHTAKFIELSVLFI